HHPSCRERRRRQRLDPPSRPWLGAWFYVANERPRPPPRRMDPPGGRPDRAEDREPPGRGDDRLVGGEGREPSGHQPLDPLHDLLAVLLHVRTLADLVRDGRDGDPDLDVRVDRGGRGAPLRTIALA